MSQHRLRRIDLHPGHRRSQITHGFKLDATLGAARSNVAAGELTVRGSGFLVFADRLPGSG